MKTQSRLVMNRHPRRRVLAKKIGRYESLEPRVVMANDFLAGTAFIDTNNNGQQDNGENYLAGATIELRTADGASLLDTRVTNSEGAYVFTNVSPGDYRLVNRSAPNYASSMALPLSEINVINGLTPSSVILSLRSPSDLKATVNMDRFDSIAISETVTVSLSGNSITTKAGQLPAVLEGNTLAVSPSNEFLTLNVDLANTLGTGLNGPYAVDASINSATGSEGNGQRIAFLYNRYGRAQLQNSVDAAGLQLAVWELLYDVDSAAPLGNLTSGNFSVTSALPETIAAAEAYLQASLNRSEYAINLNNSSSLTTRSPGILAAGSFNFANVPAAKIGDRVWHDKNVNGRIEANEPRIGGATVNLYQDSNLIATTTTDSTGFYQFDRLLAGAYRVEFVLPAGFTKSSPKDSAPDGEDSDGPLTDIINLAAGTTNNTIDQGFYNLASVGDFVWHDRNGNGFQADDEEGIANAEVKLFQNSQLIASRRTDGAGRYRFTDLEPGVYDIEFIQPDGYAYISPQGQESAPFDSDGPFAGSINLESGENDDKVDQGFFGSGVIGDYVWHDLDADGIQDSNESGINGVKVTLMDGTFEVATTVTADGGRYSFTVAPGTYTIVFTQPAEFGYVSPSNTTSDDLDSDGLVSEPVTILSDAVNNSIDVGFYNRATIGDYVWHDLDADGIQDSNESGIDDVEVRLLRGDTQVASTLTANGGKYQFNVDPGVYTVQFTQPASYSNISPVDATSDDLDSDGLTVPITVLSGATNNTIDLGLYKLVKIGNFVWNDLDADGIQDSDEAGIDGVVVSLLQGNTVVATTTTVGGGFYSFGVQPGVYTLKFTMPDGFSKNSPFDATNDELDSDDLSTTPLTIVSGVNNNSLDQGFFTQAKIGNLVWNDTDADGIRDNGEAGIDGVVVTLLRGTTVVATTTTAGGGLYSFSVDPGTYSIRFTQPAAFSNVSPTDATADDLDSDGLTPPEITVVSGQVNETIDLGLYNVSAPDVCVVIDMQGNTATSGSLGNVRTFSSGGVSVNASAFSRSTSGVWSTAYLGSFGGGLGVTDGTESGAGDTHTVDNVGQLNYVLFEFSQNVLIDAAFLGYVIGDSDISVWIGSANDPFVNRQQLSDTFLSGLALKEVNTTTSTGARSADINAAGIRGNILVIAAQTDDTTPEDFFKIASLTVCVPAIPGSGSIGDLVWHDVNGNGLQETGEPGIAGATVTLVGGGPDKLINGIGDTSTTTVTNSAGNYRFANLVPGTQYRATFSVPSGYDAATARKIGSSAALDSDAGSSDIIVLGTGENNTSIDAGFVRNVRIGNYVWNDLDQDGIQDNGEPGLAGVQLTLAGVTNSGLAVTRTTTTAANGSYQFSTLPPGTYNVSIASSNFVTGGALVGFTASPTGAGTDRGLDSNTSPSPTSPATLASAGNDQSVDFGYYSSTALACVTMKMEGNTSTSGSTGNIRTFSAGGISVKASAFARDSWGTWSNAYLGSYPGGLGVTDTSEGSGGNGTHMLDNVGRRNYICSSSRNL